MNWAILRRTPWLDTRARFVAQAPRQGSLLDLGASDGETLRHMAELRPDLHFFAADKAGEAGAYPAGCKFQRVDFERDPLPWADGSMDAITCMHVVEHLEKLDLLLREIARTLTAAGRVYFETPHPKTVGLPSAKGQSAIPFTLNFYDDCTHVKPVSAEELSARAQAAGLRTQKTGISRNWLFAAAHPFFCLLPASRQKFTARVHWVGWSAYVIAGRAK